MASGYLIQITLYVSFAFAEENIRVLDFNRPVFFESVPCDTTGAFEHFVGISMASCLGECQRRSLCRSINYNPYNKLCSLRAKNSDNSTVLNPNWCYSIDISSVKIVNKVKSGGSACDDMPCDNTSVCVDVNRFPYYTCKTAYCISSTNISNAYFRNKSPIPVGKRNQLFCQPGYVAFGQSSLECLADGNWTKANFTCYKECPSIPIKASTKISYWTTYRFVKNTTAFYDCAEGFYNITERKIVCDENGRWSEFKCLPYCRQDSIFNVVNGYPEPGDIYTIYEYASYLCNTGYYLSPGSNKVTCDVMGTWSMPEVACYPFCRQENIPIIRNGGSLPGTLYNFTMTAQYVCNAGFYLSAGSPYTVCSISGIWSTPEVECYPYCSLPQLPNAEFQPTSGPFTEKITVQYQCSSGYYLATGTSGLATCHKTGEWTYSTDCYKHCGDPPGVNDAYIKSFSAPAPYRDQDYVVYSCNSNYHVAHGTDRKVCQSSGDWAGTLVCCHVCKIYENGVCALDIKTCLDAVTDYIKGA